MAHSWAVNDIDDQQAWNWLFRAIAAQQLGDMPAAGHAFARWDALKTPADVRLLHTLVPKPFDRSIDVVAAPSAWSR